MGQPLMVPFRLDRQYYDNTTYLDDDFGVMATDMQPGEINRPLAIVTAK
jgi:hypothetical protein